MPCVEQKIRATRPEEYARPFLPRHPNAKVALRSAADIAAQPARETPSCGECNIFGTVLNFVNCQVVEQKAMTIKSHDTDHDWYMIAALNAKISRDAKLNYTTGS